MSYVQKSYKGGTPLWVGGLVALVLLSRCAMMGAAGGASTARMDTPEGVERAMFAEASTAELYRTIKRTHPDEFRALTWEIAGRVKDGQSQAQIQTAISNFVADAEARHRKEMNQAGPAALAAYLRAETGLIEALKQTDPRSCATYVTNGTVELPAGYSGPVKPITDFHVANWQAYADGRDHPVRRGPAQPTPADWALIDKAMLANGTDRQTIKAFFDPRRSAALDPMVQCDAGLSFRRAIATLPADRIDQFYLGLLGAAAS
ncbi:hypothetical protein OF829_17215 [Sphingomonas sp. LB-2]|uniref:hypothetical protein n=1 Tax=Sphingomonas caeni TaxID=2984949 RepID=UPI0022326CE1|nr:hypothetical protein [Sphingomonas caeni]MCW3848981.1 hypothetical protein [Sphingomonas caeni]